MAGGKGSMQAYGGGDGFPAEGSWSEGFTLLDQISDAVITVDPDLRVRTWNKAAERIYGWKAEEVIGRNVDEALRAEFGAGKRDEALATLMERGNVEFEATHWHRDGRKVEVQARVTLLRDSRGQPCGSVGVLRDITERKEAAEALIRSEARLAHGVEVAGLGLFEHDHRLNTLEWSPELRKIVGVGASEPITLGRFLEHVVAEDREMLARAVRQSLDPAGNGGFEVEYRVGSAGRQVRWVSARARTYFEGEGSHRRPVRTIGAVQDITERREFQTELEREVADRTAKLQELVGELEHFSYTITHDLKSPLRAMKGFADIATMTCGGCAQKGAKEYLARIAASAERMECLITDALNYSRSVRQELPLTDVDTGVLLRGMLESYPDLQPSKAHVRLEGELPVVLGNQAGLTQCFSNLLGNAVKFVRAGERPKIRVWAEVFAAGQRSGWARIWVEDNGIGISKEMLPRVFDMFSRGSKDYEGTGIGLALVRKVTQRMGGKAGVESEEGKGSRFWLELKLGELRPRAKLTDFRLQCGRMTG